MRHDRMAQGGRRACAPYDPIAVPRIIDERFRPFAYRRSCSLPPLHSLALLLSFLHRPVPGIRSTRTIVARVPGTPRARAATIPRNAGRASIGTSAVPDIAYRIVDPFPVGGLVHAIFLSSRASGSNASGFAAIISP